MTPADYRLLQAMLAGASTERMALDFGLPKSQMAARLKRLMSIVAQAPEGTGDPGSPRHRLARLRETWASRAKPEALPAHRDFRMTDLRPWFHDIAVIEAEPSPLRLTPRLMGRNLVACAGIDLSRRSLESALPTRLRDAFLEPFASCITDAAPQYAVFTCPSRHLGRHPIHLLVLPCASDGRTVDILIAAAQVEGADADGCVHRALGAYGRRIRLEAFGEFIEAGAKTASHVAETAVRNLERVAEAGNSTSATARGTTAISRPRKRPPPVTAAPDGARGR